jgi:hypothetical protein
MRPGEREFRAAVLREQNGTGDGRGVYTKLWCAEDVLAALDESRAKLRDALKHLRSNPSANPVNLADDIAEW